MTSWPTWSSQNWFSGTIWQWDCPFPRLCSWKCLCSWKYAKAQELPRLNRSSMHNLATGTFIFCRALESILSSSSSDPGVCQVSISVTVTYVLNKSNHHSRDSTICTTKMCVCTHPRAKVLTPIEVII